LVRPHRALRALRGGSGGRGRRAPPLASGCRARRGPRSRGHGLLRARRGLRSVRGGVRRIRLRRSRLHEDARGARRPPPGVAPRREERRRPGTPPAPVARPFGFAGPVMTVMTACAAGTHEIGDAARWIRDGAADVALAGGADSELYPMGLASFCLLGALSTR